MSENILSLEDLKFLEKLHSNYGLQFLRVDDSGIRINNDEAPKRHPGEKKCARQCTHVITCCFLSKILFLNTISFYLLFLSYDFSPSKIKEHTMYW